MNFAIESLGQVIEQRLPVEPGRVAVSHHASGRRDRAWGADAHRASVAQLVLGLLDQRHDGLQCGVVIAALGRDAFAQQLLTSVIHRDDLGLRSSEVDTKSEHQIPGCFLEKCLGRFVR